MKILIVEDEEFLVDVLEDQLKQEGWQVLVARDGEEALGVLKKELPNLVVLDLVLPKVDGFEVLKQLKSDPTRKQARVIVLSNLGQDEDIKKALQLGADDYFVKSQHPIEEVIEKIRGLAMTGKPGAEPKSPSPA